MPSSATSKDFDKITIASLNSLSEDQMDSLSYGVVGLSPDDIVEVFNATESGFAGLPKDFVVGAPYFLNVAQCMNNYMVAQRIQDEPDLDALVNYVLTFRMRPTPVRLRLLKASGIARRYILIERHF